MALYRQGKAAMDSSGIVTGTGTNWQSSLTLIRPGSTILFLSSPIQMAVVNKVVSDTQINAITTNGAVVPSSDYAILLSDSLTVDGLAQDVAETLRYYQSQETVIAEAVDFFKDFDLATLQALVEQIKGDAAASQDAAEESQGAAAASQQAAAASQEAASDAKAVRDEIQQIIDDSGEQSTLVALAQPDGFKHIGEANYSYIRSYTGNAEKIKVSGFAVAGDGGHGVFDLIDDDDHTIIDDNCVHLRDALGRLWKRRFLGNTIRMRWAGAKSMAETSAPQDAAFENCLLAAAQLSDSGYPQSIIAGVPRGVVYLAQRHYIRCGNFPESLSWKYPTTGGGDRFGFDMTCAIGEGAGFFLVQANNPSVRLRVDNSQVAFSTTNYTDEQIATLVQNNYILRMESMVNAPDLHIHAANYPGTVLYSTGKKDYSAVTAQWTDLVSVLPSIQAVGDVVLNIKTCGRDFYFTNTGAGMGHWNSVWTQNNRVPGSISNCYDLTMTYEDYVPHNETSGGLILSECGTMSLKNILIGAGGVGHLCIWDSRNVHINRNIAICGNTTYAASNTADDLYALEVCNSEVNISGAHVQNSGRFMRVGFNSQVTFQHMTAWDVSTLVEMTNNLSRLKYRGQRVLAVLDPSRVFFNGGFAQNLNASQFGWPCAPIVKIDETVGGDFQFHWNLWTNNAHAGYADKTEAELYFIECKSTSNTGLVSFGEAAKLEGNTSNYFVYLQDKNQLGPVNTRATNFVRVRYGDTSQSSFAMREASHPLEGTTFTAGSIFSYPYRRPGRHTVGFTISGGSVSVTVNGQVRHRYTSDGLHTLALDLRLQEQVLIITTGTVVTSMPQWRYILEN